MTGVEGASGMDVATLHRRTVQDWEARVDAVGDDDWVRPTPCTGWTVRDLVNHVVGEELWAVPLLEGRAIADVGDRFDGDVLGEAPHDVCHRAADAAARAVDGAPPDGVVHLSYGDERVEEYVRQLAADHLVHGWDLSVATGGDPRLDPELVAEVAAWFVEREELYRAGGVVGPHASSGGDPQADLLAAFGRDARWAATP
ncbi:MAG: TIGR03086 family metal-binding protein [Actinomycetes bacterium]